MKSSQNTVDPDTAMEKIDRIFLTQEIHYSRFWLFSERFFGQSGYVFYFYYLAYVEDVDY